jgi:branched-chain amino acid transport system permease protein
LLRGRVGRAVIAIRDHPIAARTMGIDTVFYKSAVFGISAMLTPEQALARQVAGSYTDSLFLWQNPA